MSSYYNLGSHRLTITTSSPEGQVWFDRGLLWCYGFNHGEASHCFRRALESDPDCAMAYWGIAHALGPNYNKPWDAFDEAEFKSVLAEAYEASAKSVALLDVVTEMEQALIGTLPFRYPTATPGPDLSGWVEDHVTEMRRVYHRFPDHPDICTLFAESLMNRTPWNLWDLKTGGIAEGASTAEAKEVLESALQRIEDAGGRWHPGLLHMYIHLMEMSPNPEMALKVADRLRGLVPDSGHLQHMPAHIYVICGQYEDAIRVSRKAITADDQYVDFAGRYNFYTTSRCHDLHMMMYASMFAGQFEPAIQAAQTLTATLSADLLAVERPHMAVTLEGYHSTFMHVFVRFGKWQEIIDCPLPDDPELYCVSTAMCHYARSVAHSALGQIDAATEERDLFRAARKQVPESRLFFNNNANDILAIADAMMVGELEYRKENYEIAFNHLETAVQLNDNLYYTEPWAWMHPPRHALGALLLEQGHVEKAEQVYRADLGIDKNLARPLQHPNNVWGLHGYLECLQRTDQIIEAKGIQESLNSALALSGEIITSSCYCRHHH